jgi:competence protein ComEC
MHPRPSHFNIAMLFACLLCASCSNIPDSGGERFSLAALDVGQALSQVAIAGSSALLFDAGRDVDSMGGADTVYGSSSQWLKQMRRAQVPFISSIVISHSHADHLANASALDSTASFSGIVVASPYEDTAAIRNAFGAWQSRISFALKRQGDTVGGLPGVRVDCLWPPDTVFAVLPLPDSLRNRFSLVFRISAGSTAALITSDIDTVAESSLARTYGWGLESGMLVAPHHGSAGSVGDVFFGYVNPQFVIVSCGRDNSYGHPSSALYAICFRMQSRLLATFELGGIQAFSNGEYWMWQTVQ